MELRCEASFEVEQLRSKLFDSRNYYDLLEIIKPSVPAKGNLRTVADILEYLGVPHQHNHAVAVAVAISTFCLTTLSKVLEIPPRRRYHAGA